LFNKSFLSHLLIFLFILKIVLTASQTVVIEIVAPQRKHYLTADLGTMNRQTVREQSFLTLSTVIWINEKTCSEKKH